MAAPHVLAKPNPCFDTAASSGHCACGCYRKTVRLFILLSVCTCLFCLACCLITVFILWRPVQCNCIDQAAGPPPETNGDISVQVRNERSQMSKVEEKDDVTYVYPIRHKRDKKKASKQKASKPPCDCSSPKELKKNCKKVCKKEGNRCEVQAAHYVAWGNITFSDFNHTFSTELCKYLPNRGGSICRNGTFLLNTSSVNLTTFREAGWVKKESNPFNFDPNSGKFIVKHSGLYLVYSQVLFNGRWPKQAIRLMHEAKTGQMAQSLTCFHGIVGDTDVYTSCGMMGVFQMTEGDSVIVQSLYRNVKIELNSNHTYFGGVLLSSNHNRS
ncbi:hypothetical protein ACJMK2_019330 [Sinanodonta woodiana]|uniref:THD domain-containing protein n=1 Tax=Sinanodonta woodiana TaxID=1069815 RepID=A0ABD3UG44_SINWO